MPLLTRRRLIKGLGATIAGGVALAGYGFGFEPLRAPRIVRYALTPANWPQGLALSIAVLADIHAGEPFMTADRIDGIGRQAMALRPDVIVLLGDFTASHRFQSHRVAPRQWAEVLGGLKAPLGVHAVLGNHDWWEDAQAQATGAGPVVARRELERVGIPVYENDAVRLHKGGQPFWLAATNWRCVADGAGSARPTWASMIWAARWRR